MSYDYTGTSKYTQSTTDAYATVPLTMMAWAYPTEDASNIVFCTWNTGTGSNGYTLTTRGTSSDGFDFEMRNDLVTTANFINGSAWNCLVGIAAALDDRKSYLNGDTANKGTNTVSNSAATPNRMEIASRVSKTAGDFEGKIAECVIWNVALSEDEIVALSKGVNPWRIRPLNIVYLFPLRAPWDSTFMLNGVTSMSSTGSPALDDVHPPITPFSLNRAA